MTQQSNPRLSFEYGEYLRHRHVQQGNIWVGGDIMDGAAGFYHREMSEAAQFANHLDIFIDSFGGSVSEALAVHDLIRSFATSIPCRTIGVGFVASAACLIILQAGDERLSYPHTRYMIHELGRMLGGGAERKSESEDVVREMKHLQDFVLNLFCKRTGTPLKTLTKAIARKSLYLDASDALKWGIIDRIVDTVDLPPAGISDFKARAQC